MRNSNVQKLIALCGIFVALQAASSKAATPVAPVPKDKNPAPFAAIAEDSSKWRRDPFIGPDAKSAKLQAGTSPAGIKIGAAMQSPELNVQGIMQADNAFHALINGRVVKTGDKLDGLTIREISRYRVVVQNGNKEKSVYDIYQGRIDRGKQ